MFNFFGVVACPPISTVSVFPQTFLSRLVDRYYSCCWISNLVRYANSAWLVSTNISLSKRSDNGKINSSPVSRSPAMVRFQQGCQKSLTIPVEDPDNDFVKCRWATSAESSIPSDSFPYGKLDEVTLHTLSMQFFSISKYKT